MKRFAILAIVFLVAISAVIGVISKLPVAASGSTTHSVKIFPNDDGSTIEMTPYPQNLQNYDCVDDDPANDLEYVWAQSCSNPPPYQRDLYTIDSSDIPDDSTIRRVKVYARTGKTGAGCKRYAKAAVKIGDTIYEGDEKSSSYTGWSTWLLQDWATNPATSGTWTVEAIADAEWGLSLRNNCRCQYARCSQFYLEVEYIGDDNDEDEPEFGGEWTNEGALEEGDDSVEGLYTKLVGAGSWEPTPRSFLYGEDDAWEDHWKDITLDGDDINYIDRVDLAMFQGHCTSVDSVRALDFLDTTHDDEYLEWDEAKWGEYDSEWVLLHCCQVLNDESRDYWANALNGAHLICGGKTTMYDYDDGGWVGDLLISEGPMDYPHKVKSAWFEGCDVNQPSTVTLRVIGEDSDCGDDYVWGQGDVCDDPTVDEYYSYWDYECHDYP